jgi:WD40 repeat protein
VPGEAVRAEGGLDKALAEVDRMISESSHAEAAVRLRELRQRQGYERDPALLERWRQAGAGGRRTGLLALWLERPLEGHLGQVLSVALAPNGRRAMTLALELPQELWLAQLWDLPSGRYLHALGGQCDSVCAAALTADGCFALTGGFGGAVQLWELSNRCCVRTLEGHTDSVASIALTPDGRLALTGSNPDLDQGSERTVQLWDLENGRCVRTLTGPLLHAKSVALTPDGRHALAGGNLGRSARWRGTAQLWELPGGRCLGTLEGHTKPVVSVALSSDGRVALTGEGSGTIRLWELPGGRCLRTLEGHPQRAESVALSAGARFALTGGSEHTLRLWELDWDYEFPDPADWDEGARPLVETFLHSHVPYAVPLAEEGPLRSGSPTWDEADFDSLLHVLQDAGFGWLRPEGVRRELQQLAAAMDESA